MKPSGDEKPLTGLEIALQWSKLPPDHLRSALKGLEPQLAREHEYRMAILQLQDKASRERRAMIKYMVGMVAGLIVALGMLGTAALLGLNDQPWLAAAFSGPGVIALVKIFVLGRSAAADIREMRRAITLPSPMAPTSAQSDVPPLV
ncbi:hypothetical protein ABT158_48520 [Nonomuraea sp. NPDC001636]|uniref:hypothetical protein n=1 Tax=Nonomuraea sp. NPDC001636 TaxID=3154391 RepID=UPI0033318F95